MMPRSGKGSSEERERKEVRLFFQTDQCNVGSEEQEKVSWRLGLEELDGGGGKDWGLSSQVCDFGQVTASEP